MCCARCERPALEEAYTHVTSSDRGAKILTAEDAPSTAIRRCTELHASHLDGEPLVCILNSRSKHQAVVAEGQDAASLRPELLVRVHTVGQQARLCCAPLVAGQELAPCFLSPRLRRLGGPGARLRPDEAAL